MSDYNIAAVRLRDYGPVEPFLCEQGQVEPGAMCIVSFDRGQDYGKVLKIDTVEDPDIPEKQRVVRPCQPGDVRRIERNAKDADRNVRPCQREIDGHTLDMKLVNAEYTFDRGKIVFYFAAEHRVDFRQLVRNLARKFKVRIELRQIGVRDETKVTGGIGCCGRLACCKAWIHEFSPVNIRMAKLQQIQLHPTKLSGICGRLKCCLGYEYRAYCDIQAHMPSKGQRVRTPQGTGDVADVSLLSGEVTVKFDDETVVTVPGKDVTVVSRTKARAKARVRRRKARQSTPPPRAKMSSKRPGASGTKPETTGRRSRSVLTGSRREPT